MIKWFSLLLQLEGITALEGIMYSLVLIMALQGVYEKYIKKIIGKADKENSNNSQEEILNSRLATRHGLMIFELDKLLDERAELRHSTIIEEQLNILDSVIDAITRSMKDDYFQLLQGKGYSPAEIMSGIDYKHYSACVEILSFRLSKDVLRMMRENGLHKRNEIEMQTYLDLHWRHAQDTASNVFDVYYSGPLIIDRTELHSFHTKKLSDHRKVFENTIRECREISINYEVRLQVIEEKIQYIKTRPCLATINRNVEDEVEYKDKK